MRAKEFLIEGYKEVTQKYASAGADPTQLSKAIADFKEIVDKNQVSGNERNIDWWGKHKSFDEFSNFVNSIDLERTKTQVTRKKVVGNSINLIDNDLIDSNKWLVVIPLDKEASCFHGKNSDWCTTKTNQKHFEEYFGKGITLIYCLNKTTGGMWAIASGGTTGKMELFDQKDNSLTKAQFKQQTGMNPAELVTLATKHKKPIQDARIKVAMQDPRSAYEYARDVIKGRFPEWEKVIASDPRYAYAYARDVIQGRFPEGEKVIASDPDYAYAYAKNVIKGRFPEGEKVIASVRRTADLYAKNVIKGRFPEWEKVIASDPRYAYAYEYARDVIKGRWPEAEKAIASNPEYAYPYARDVIKGRWPEAEKAIASDPRYAYEYAENVIKGRWPEAEKVIASDPAYAYYYAKNVIKDPDPETWWRKIYLAGKTK